MFVADQKSCYAIEGVPEEYYIEKIYKIKFILLYGIIGIFWTFYRLIFHFHN